MPLIRRQLRRYSKLLRNISLFSNILSPSVFHRMGWTFFGTRVAPSLLNLMVTQEVLIILITKEIVEAFIL